MISKAKGLVLRTLRWSERYTKTDMVYLASGGFWLTLGQVALAGIAFTLSVAFAHFVEKDTYGTYRFLLSLFWTLTAFSLTGLPAAFARAVAQGKDGAYGQAIRLSIIWGWPMVLISFGVAIYYYLQGNFLVASGAVIIGIVGPLMQGAYLYGSFLEGKKAFRTNALAGIVLNAVPAFVLFIAILLSAGPITFLIIYLATNVATGTTISFFVYHRYRTRGAPNDKSLMHLSGHYSLMNILSTLSQQIDRLLVFHYLGAVQLAVYVFATAMPDQIKTVFNGISTLAFPKFANRPLSEIIPTLQHRIRNLTILVTLVAVVYIVLAPFAFHIFFPAYTESIFYSQLYALTLVAISNVIPLALLQAQAAKRELYIFNIASPTFQILTLFILIASYGLIGAIMARILGRAFNVIICNYLMYSYKKRTLT